MAMHVLLLQCFLDYPVFDYTVLDYPVVFLGFSKKKSFFFLARRANMVFNMYPLGFWERYIKAKIKDIRWECLHLRGVIFRSFKKIHFGPYYAFLCVVKVPNINILMCKTLRAWQKKDRKIVPRRSNVACVISKCPEYIKG